MRDFSVKPVGSSGVLVCFGNKIQEEINAKVTALETDLTEHKLSGVSEMVPSFASLLIRFDPLATDYAEMRAEIGKRAERLAQTALSAGKTVEIPVCYGGKYGEDLPFVAQHAGLTERQVIERHSGRDYRIYMLGFLPGFPYLGGMDERLFTPRLANPRTIIPAGSVGIGGEQTGVYPMESPGGWQLIGRTPLRLFAPEEGGKLPYRAGDRIRFVPIPEAEYARLAAQQAGGASV